MRRSFSELASLLGSEDLAEAVCNTIGPRDDRVKIRRTFLREIRQYMDDMREVRRRQATELRTRSEQLGTLVQEVDGVLARIVDEHMPVTRNERCLLEVIQKLAGELKAEQDWLVEMWVRLMPAEQE